MLKAFHPDLKAIHPDRAFGAPYLDVDSRIREDKEMKELIIPTTNETEGVLPNCFIELKGPKGHLPLTCVNYVTTELVAREQCTLLQTIAQKPYSTIMHGPLLAHTQREQSSCLQPMPQNRSPPESL